MKNEFFFELYYKLIKFFLKRVVNEKGFGQ
jgi:hypothetical protein